MQTISLDLENCFGIQKMHQTLRFNDSNVLMIYARNGLMKTSFTKTIKKIQEGKNTEICDVIFGDDGTSNILIDGREATADDFFVINSFESAYESDITPLLVRGTIKEHLRDILKQRDKFLKYLAEKSGLKVKKTLGGKTIYELENAIIDDFGFEERSILINLEALANYESTCAFANITYATIFETSVMAKIKSASFQERIADFVANVNRIYDSFAYMKQGEFTLPKLRNIRKALEKEKFFVNENKIMLTGIESINSLDELKNRINEVETEIRKIPALAEIENMLSDAKGSLLLDEIELHPEIVEYLAVERLDELKKILWLSYIESAADLFDELRRKYSILSNEIDNIEIDDTPWKNALTIFEKRFFVPYQMNIENLRGAIIGESVPHVMFTFTKGNRTRQITRRQLDEVDTLSQGEKRALYLLNIIFDIEQVKNTGMSKIFIIDDIADSFDYKNKYAIIEYLYELSQNDQFYLIILSHNFDFYRTVASRLPVKRTNRLFAEISNNQVVFTQEFYQNNPFEYWKSNLCKKNVLAMIPFVRNLIEYGRDDNVSQAQSDYLFLTSLLHKKEETSNITFSQLLDIYSHYLGVNGFEGDIDLSQGVVDELLLICDSITPADVFLENKVILAVGIRHLSEKFMISKIRNCTLTLTWKARKTNKVGNSQQFMNDLASMKNQTREIYNVFCQIGNTLEISIFNEVNIMTPENIHLNSFMYEPILDMDIDALLDLYVRVKNLVEN